MQPLVQAILAGVGRKAPAKMPVRIHPLPTLPKVGEAGIGGILTQDPMVEQLRIVEEEKAKAKAFATEAKLAKEKDVSV